MATVAPHPGQIVDILQPSAVLTAASGHPGHPITLTQPFNLTRPAVGTAGLHLQPQKLILASAATPAGLNGGPSTVQPLGSAGVVGHPPRLLVPAQQVALLQTANGTTQQLTNTSPHGLEVKKEGLSIASPERQIYYTFT